MREKVGSRGQAKDNQVGDRAQSKSIFRLLYVVHERSYM